MEVATRLLAVLGLVLALLLAGCTYSRDEPGLFRVRSPSPAPSTSPTAEMPEQPAGTDTSGTDPVDPSDLPVAGELLWTTGEGAEVTVRLAVHALRRIPGATVLDWSVTPLAAPGLRAGDPLPSQTDLGLSRQGGADLGIWLLDPAARQAYRSLTHESRREYHHCLCSPLWSVQPELRIGRTRLLQATFPPLPARAAFLDVFLANLAPVRHVPVTPTGQVPTAAARVDLARPADRPAPAGRPVPFRYPDPQSDRVSSVTVDRVVSAPGWTAVEWTLRSLTDQYQYRRQPLGPPVSAPRAADVEVTSDNPADGPSVRPAGSGAARVPASWMTTRNTGRPAYECLCSDVGLWARALGTPGGAAHLVSLYPALRAGTRAVEVTMPGMPVVRVPVTTAPDAARRLGPPVTNTGRTWVYSDDVPPQGWPVQEWPSPLPDEWQLPDYRAFVEDVGPLPRSP